MDVAAILKTKGNAVVTALPDVSVEAIARKLAENKVGAIVILATDGGLAGIASERDIITAIALHGAACLSEPVATIMTRTVKTCETDDTIEELMAVMTAGRFRHLPVVQDGALAGIVSVGDIVKHHVAEVEMEASALRGYVAG